MGVFIFFIGEKTSFFLGDFVYFAVGKLKAEVAAFCVPAFQFQLPSGSIVYFPAGFNGIIQSVGKNSTEKAFCRCRY